jgi:hypothetical protein
VPARPSPVRRYTSPVRHLPGRGFDLLPGILPLPA